MPPTPPLLLRIAALALLLMAAAVPAAWAGLDDTCPLGQRKCGFSTCCGAGERCSWDGHCIPHGYSYCGGGRRSRRERASHIGVGRI